MVFVELWLGQQHRATGCFTHMGKLSKLEGSEDARLAIKDKIAAARGCSEDSLPDGRKE